MQIIFIQFNILQENLWAFTHVIKVEDRNLLNFFEVVFAFKKKKEGGKQRLIDRTNLCTIICYLVC